MAVEDADLKLFLSYRRWNTEGRSCAIFGDISFPCFGRGKEKSIDEFKTRMKFDTVHTFDILGNPTHKINLNEPLPEELYSQYDWLIDGGTIACCFNVAAAWKNALSLLKESCYIVHTSNLSGHYGRVFYAVSPSLYRDFYKANNFEILGMGTKTRQKLTWHGFNPNNTYLKEASSRCMDFQERSGSFVEYIPNDSQICCVARREKSVEFTEPIPQHFIDTNGA